LRPLRRGDSSFGATVPARHARGVQWVHLHLVGEVACTGWTSDEVLRHPSWRGLRTGKDPGQVHQETDIRCDPFPASSPGMPDTGLTV
jgi:bifunctional non-homologous end joining protein LigD